MFSFFSRKARATDADTTYDEAVAIREDLLKERSTNQQTLGKIHKAHDKDRQTWEAERLRLQLLFETYKKENVRWQEAHRESKEAHQKDEATWDEERTVLKQSNDEFFGNLMEEIAKHHAALDARIATSDQLIAAQNKIKELMDQMMTEREQYEGLVNESQEQAAKWEGTFNKLREQTDILLDVNKEKEKVIQEMRTLVKGYDSLKKEGAKLKDLRDENERMRAELEGRYNRAGLERPEKSSPWAAHLGWAPDKGGIGRNGEEWKKKPKGKKR